MVKTLSSSPADLSFSFSHTFTLLSLTLSLCTLPLLLGDRPAGHFRCQGAYAGRLALCRHSGSGEFHIDPQKKKLIIIIIIIMPILKSDFGPLYGFGSFENIRTLFSLFDSDPCFSYLPQFLTPTAFTPFVGCVLCALSFLNCLTSVFISSYL